jgi:hypothetical protein
MSTVTHDVQECIDVCNSLLRGEISAVEAYNEAIHRFPKEREAIVVLEGIRREHVDSINLLRHNVESMGGEPARESGAWGGFVKTVESAANLFGTNSALQMLIQGEEHGRNEYEEALANENVMTTCKGLIRDQLLPTVIKHIALLKRLQKAV